MKKEFLFLLTAFFSIIFLSHAQNYEWARSLSGSGFKISNSIALDKWGNVYTTGYFKGTVDFDPGSGVSYLTSAGGYDIFVCKLDASGNYVWAKRIGGIKDDQGNGIAVDSQGNVFTAGSFIGTVDFDPGNAVYNLTAVEGSSVDLKPDIFVTKMDNSGNFVWAKSMGSPGEDVATAIALDRFGNVHTTGNFNASCDFDPGAGTYSLLSHSTYMDAFVSKLDNAGNFIWAADLGGSLADIGYAIAVDDSDNVYTTGTFLGDADFDPGQNTNQLHAVYPSTDIFVSKLNAGGNYVWAKSLGSNIFNKASAIAVDRWGNVITTGLFQETGDFDPGTGIYNLTAAGSTDIFISKLNASGNMVFAKKMGSTGIDQGLALTLDTMGNIYTAGFFVDTVDFDPGPGINNLTAAGSWDIYLSKLDTVGNFLWALDMGGKNEEYPTAMTLDPDGNIYTTGIFFDTCDFDPGGSVHQLISAVPGIGDIFISRLNVCHLDTAISHSGNTIQVSYNSANNYQWIRCSDKQPIAGASGSSYTATESGSYAVIISSGSCIDTSACVEMTYTGIHDLAIDNSWRIFPNPVKDQLNIEVKEEGTLLLFNGLGQVVWKESVRDGKQIKSINGLAAGIYILQYQTKHGSGFSRIVKN